MTRLYAILLALSIVSTSIANDGYTCRADGYYYDCNGQAYTRERYQYYYNRHCWYWAYRYVPYYATAVKKDWRSAIIGIAERRDENNAFLDALKALGLNDSVSIEEYKILQRVAPSRRLSHYRNAYSEGYNAEQGDTVFSVSQLSDVYNNNDLSVLYQQSARLVENAQGLAGDANAGFTDAIRAEGRERARIAEIIAKTTLVREALRAATPPHSESTEVTTLEDDEVTATDLHTLLASKCLKCHNDIKTSGGVDLGKYDTFSEIQKRKVLLSIVSGKMPKGGRPLAMVEINLFK